MPDLSIYELHLILFWPVLKLCLFYKLFMLMSVVSNYSSQGPDEADVIFGAVRNKPGQQWNRHCALKSWINLCLSQFAQAIQNSM